MEKRGTGGARMIGEILREVVRETPAFRKGERQELDDAWLKAVGPEVARCTRVVGLARGTLTVDMESAVLRHEIEAFRKPEILSKLREACPSRRIVSLRCVLRPS